jgi:hypothetical protein
MLVEDDGSGIRVAFGGHVFASCFYGPPTVERLNFLFEHEKRWVSSLPKFSSIAVVDPRIGKEMNGEARKRAAEIAGHFKDKMAASITVVPGTGFFPAMVRSVMAGIQLMSDRKIKWHIANDTADALRFVEDVHTQQKLPLDILAAKDAVDRVLGRKAA